MDRALHRQPFWTPGDPASARGGCSSCSSARSSPRTAWAGSRRRSPGRGPRLLHAPHHRERGQLGLADRHRHHPRAGRRRPAHRGLVAPSCGARSPRASPGRNARLVGFRRSACGRSSARRDLRPALAGHRPSRSRLRSRRGALGHGDRLDAPARPEALRPRPRRVVRAHSWPPSWTSPASSSTSRWRPSCCAARSSERPSPGRLSTLRAPGACARAQAHAGVIALTARSAERA